MQVEVVGRDAALLAPPEPVRRLGAARASEQVRRSAICQGSVTVRGFSGGRRTS